MVRLRPALSEEEVKKAGVAEIRRLYVELARDYNKIVNGDIYHCPRCNEFHSSDTFYSDKKYAVGFFPICKRCLIKMACNYDKKTNIYMDNKEKTMYVLKLMDLPYIDSVYQSALTSTSEEIADKHRNTAWSQYITMIKSLPNWRGKTWKDSEMPADYVNPDEEQINENSRTLKNAQKRFGRDYPANELIYLENEYQDWVKRYPCENKAQEVLYENICRTQLNIDKKQRAGKDTKDDLKTLQDLMTSLQIKPSQTNSNALTEAKTFGQLIEKWEDEWDGGKPIPEPDPDFADVDKIVPLIETFFKGHLAKMMGLKNGFSQMYDKYISKYTVKRPTYDEDSESEVIFEQLFGKEDEI